ncbi:MAG: zinc ribbon domain-containing protein [Bacteroidales bacterium]|nr:zinc ribbon domain-containing protein [Bacteroidales bacterium]
MKCTKCNAELAEGAKFCPECGAKIEIHIFCANCGTKLGEGAMFCSNCGEKVGCEDQETKKCPYCGEEILATATKCKHCGEWIEEQDEEDDSEEEVEDNEVVNNKEDDDTLLKKNVPFSNTILEIAFWVAIIGLCIYSIHDILPEGTVVKAKGKAAILSIATIIPQWVGYILEPIGLTVLLFSLKRAMSMLKTNFDILFTLLIVAVCGSNITNLIIDVFSGELSLLLIMFRLAQWIIALILGIKIRVTYNGEISNLGRIMCIYGIVGLVMFSVFFIGMIIMYIEGIDDAYWLEFIITIIGAVISYFFYKKLMDVQMHS